MRSGLRDQSVSRTTFKWGIPVPGDEKHVIYVWFDALVNYLTAVGYGSDDPKDQAKLKHYWPADVHVIGKEIVRFHCVYWPAFLLAADIPLPKSIVAHGWLLFEESKMSKSRGNIVRTETILDTLGADTLRYFLLREIVFGSDGSFSFDALVQRFNADLANGLGNLSSRTLSMITRYFEGEIPYPSPGARTAADDAVAALAEQTIVDFNAQFEQFQFSRALETAWGLVAAVNKYIVENEPWAVAEKEDQDSRARLATILHTSAEALRIITALVHPVIPDSSARIWGQLGLGDITKLDLRNLAWGQLPLHTELGTVEAVFPRADKSTIERMQQMEQERAAQSSPAAVVEKTEEFKQPEATAVSTAAVAAAPAASAPVSNTITIDDFAKIELRVGQVKVAEKVKGTDKLLRLEVDLGTEVRQVVAGIAKAYDPEKLIGRKVVIVANLAPRKLRGLESQGMIVAASLGDDGAAGAGRLPRRRTQRSAPEVGVPFFANVHRFALSSGKQALRQRPPRRVCAGERRWGHDDAGHRQWRRPWYRHVRLRDQACRTIRRCVRHSRYPSPRGGAGDASRLRSIGCTLAASEGHCVGRDRPRLLLRSLTARSTAKRFSSANGVGIFGQTPDCHSLSTF